jgi:hypothetical protein
LGEHEEAEQVRQRHGRQAAESGACS